MPSWTISFQNHKPLHLNNPASDIVTDTNLICLMVFNGQWNCKSTRGAWLVNKYFKLADLMMLWKHKGILHIVAHVQHKIGDYQAPPICGSHHQIRLRTSSPSVLWYICMGTAPVFRIWESQSLRAVGTGSSLCTSASGLSPRHGHERARGNLMLATQALWSCGSACAPVSEAERFIP